MRHLLVTTMLILPFGAGVAFAQETTPEDIGEATGDAVETTVEGIEEGAEAAGEAVQGAVEEAQAETGETEGEVEVEVVPADEADAEGTEVVQTDEPAGEAIMREQAANELRVDWITGTTVTSPDGETIGNVNDLILDGETGELTAAILSVGGFLGIGAKQIAVNWSELQIDYDANEISMNLTREEAEAAPEYVFRDQEQPPAPVPADPAAGVGTGGAMGTGGVGGAGTTGAVGTGGVQD